MRNAKSVFTGLALGLAFPTAVFAASHLLWENHEALAGNHKQYRSIAAAGQLVFAVGEAGALFDLGLQTPTDNMDGFVRAIDAKTGATVWQDRIDIGPYDTFDQVATDGARVFVGGT